MWQKRVRKGIHKGPTDWENEQHHHSPATTPNKHLRHTCPRVNGNLSLYSKEEKWTTAELLHPPPHYPCLVVLENAKIVDSAAAPIEGGCINRFPAQWLLSPKAACDRSWLFIGCIMQSSRRLGDLSFNQFPFINRFEENRPFWDPQ